MKCPKCRVEEMTVESFQGIEIDRCPTCKGIFLDRGEIRALIAKKMGNVADTLFFSHTSDMMDDVAGVCTRCNKQMGPVNGPGDIKVDACPQCGGLFLDQGELATMQSYFP